MNHLKFRAFGDKNNTLIVCQQKMDAHSGNFLHLCHIFLASSQQETAFQTTYNPITRFFFSPSLATARVTSWNCMPYDFTQEICIYPKKSYLCDG